MTKKPTTTTNNDGLRRIEEDFDAFRDGVKRCREAEGFARADWEDAYERLARVRDRFEFERYRKHLSRSEEAALRKVFQDDSFIRGMMTARTIGAHVVQRQRIDPVLYVKSNGPITLTAECSAGALFGAPIVTVADADGQHHGVNHLEQLSEAERRVEIAIQRARGAK